ncbi:hypothetical protein SAMN05444000_12122 [Shimia gijangensis]|uniref:Uncharacterized protein n=1 Tax=Shimia gijangensis TaxID=1470563 RepID=A0A1M6QE82_9RHOB|nr:hypothetical protein SAMN05444000_12122 [Shimia gijangensis]
MTTLDIPQYIPISECVVDNRIAPHLPEGKYYDY